MTAAAQIGIDSCPIEGFNLDMVTQILIEAGVLDDEIYKPSVMAASGYRATDPQYPQARRAIEEVVEWVL